VTRASGSHSAYDLIAVVQIVREDEGEIYPLTHVQLIQCKVVKKLTTAALKKLQEEVAKTSPIKYEVQHSEFYLDVVLVVKEQGKSTYTKYYPLEFVNARE
jgi:hypothetical protein